MVFYYQLSEWVLLTGKTNYCVSIYLSFTVSVRGCRPEVFIYQAIPNFVTFTEKHQRWSSFYSNLEFRIDGTPRLLIIPFFVTPPPTLINFGEFCQPPLLFLTPRLLIHGHSRQR